MFTHKILCTYIKIHVYICIIHMYLPCTHLYVLTLAAGKHMVSRQWCTFANTANNQIHRSKSIAYSFSVEWVSVFWFVYTMNYYLLMRLMKKGNLSVSQFLNYLIDHRSVSFRIFFFHRTHHKLQRGDYKCAHKPIPIFYYVDSQCLFNSKITNWPWNLLVIIEWFLTFQVER